MKTDRSENEYSTNGVGGRSSPFSPPVHSPTDTQEESCFADVGTKVTTCVLTVALGVVKATAGGQRSAESDAWISARKHHPVMKVRGRCPVPQHSHRHQVSVFTLERYFFSITVVKTNYFCFDEKICNKNLILVKISNEWKKLSRPI